MCVYTICVTVGERFADDLRRAFPGLREALLGPRSGPSGACLAAVSLADVRYHMYTDESD